MSAKPLQPQHSDQHIDGAESAPNRNWGTVEEFLSSYQTSLNMNQLQQVCADERDIPAALRFEALKCILQTGSSGVDINDESFQVVVQTSYRLKNRPDAIPEVRRTVPAPESNLSSPGDRENMVTLTTNPSQLKQATSSSPIPQTRSLGSTKDQSQAQPQHGKGSNTTTPYTTQNYHQDVRVHFDQPSQPIIATQPAPTSADEQLRTRDLLILHLCQELQQFLTAQQYNNYVSRLFEDSGIDPPQYSEKRGGSYLSRPQRPPKTELDPSELAALVLGTSSQHPHRPQNTSQSIEPSPAVDENSTDRDNDQNTTSSTTSHHRTNSSDSIPSSSPTVRPVKPLSADASDHDQQGTASPFATASDVIPEEPPHPRLLIVRTNPYFSALHYICQNTATIANRFQILQFMFESGSVANGHRQYNISPLYDIIINPAITDIDERIKMVKLLIHHGANVNIHDSNKNNLVHVIISAPHLTVLDKKRLIMCLRDAGINMNHSNRYQHSPLETLCFSYQQQSLLPPVKSLFLSDRTPSQQQQQQQQQRCLPTPPVSESDFEEPQLGQLGKKQTPSTHSKTTTPLQHPLKYGPPKPNEQFIITPLSVTSCPIYEETIQDRLDLVTFLLRHGTSVSGLTPGTTLLHQLCANNFPNRLHYINALLRNGAPVNITDDSGDTPLHCLLANDRDSVGIIQLLWQDSMNQYAQRKDSLKEVGTASPTIAPITEPENSQNQRPNAPNSFNQTSKSTKYQIIDNLGSGMLIKKECIDILAEVFLKDGETPASEHVLTSTSTSVQSIPEDDLAKRPTSSQTSSASSHSDISDGLAICKALLRQGVNTRMINKNEYQAIDQHYFMLRGKLALDASHKAEFIKMCQFESFTTSQPASELASHHAGKQLDESGLQHLPYLHLYRQVYQAGEDQIDQEEFHQQLMNLIHKHPVEIPFTNWLAKQHKLIREHDAREYHNTSPLHNDNDDFASISRSYPHYRHQQAAALKNSNTSEHNTSHHNALNLEGSDSYLGDLHQESSADQKSPEYSVSYHELPSFMPNEMPIMPNIKVQEPITATRSGRHERRPSYLDVIPLNDFVLPTIDLPIRKNPTNTTSNQSGEYLAKSTSPIRSGPPSEIDTTPDQRQ